MTMGEKIKYLREKNGMTLEELGNKVGVGKSTVRKWETGMIANMRRDKIQKLANALNVSPAYLMGWEDDVQTSGQEQSYYLDDETKEIVELMRHNQDYQTILSASKKLSQEDLKIARAFIERMSQ